MLNRYAARLDSEFQQRTLLVSRSPNARKANHRQNHAATLVIDSAIQPTAAVSRDPQLVELAQDLGVEPERLPFVIDQFRGLIERRSNELASREAEADKLVSAINRIESGWVTTPFSR